MLKPKIIVCIPARYGSTRFPGKVLAKKTGKFLIQHVYEQACLARLPDKVIIAADDKRIADAAKSFGASCIMTSPDCPSGTDRIAQAIQKLSAIRYPLSADDVVVNLQADEPEIDPANIDTVAQLLITQNLAPASRKQGSKLKTMPLQVVGRGQNYCMATLAADFQTQSQVADPNVVKVIVAWSVERIADSTKLYATRYPLSANCGKAIYFSRSVIPYDRQQGGIGPVKNYLRHLGIYAYRRDFLLKITKMPQTPLEKIEKLEQLRAIENGFNILVAKVKHTCPGIDTPGQYEEFVKRYSHRA